MEFLESFFSVEREETFTLFSVAHLSVLIILLLAIIGLYVGRFTVRKKWNKPLRYGMAAFLLLSEIAIQLWSIVHGKWDAAYSLPLALCSVTVLLSAVMLVTRNHRLYEFTFFAGIGGALQALLTPDLFYTFPHFRYFHFFVAHAFIILACLFMTWVEGYRPRFRSIWTTLGWLNIYMVPVALVNWWTGGNYLFISRKPPQGSLLDILGPWPWYIVSMEAAAIVIFLLLYAPFLLRRKKAAPSKLVS